MWHDKRDVELRKLHLESNLDGQLSTKQQQEGQQWHSSIQLQEAGSSQPSESGPNQQRSNAQPSLVNSQQEHSSCAEPHFCDVGGGGVRRRAGAEEPSGEGGHKAQAAAVTATEAGPNISQVSYPTQTAEAAQTTELSATTIRSEMTDKSPLSSPQSAAGSAVNNAATAGRAATADTDAVQMAADGLCAMTFASGAGTTASDDSQPVFGLILNTVSSSWPASWLGNRHWLAIRKLHGKW